VTLSRKARCRALQLPAWNEALSLPRPWDQQWALRLQQILAYETDLLEYPDLFDGNPVDRRQDRGDRRRRARRARQILAMGGVQAAIDAGYMKQALVRR
jgi:(2R)-ethylmalonyl-CoA mutase